MDGEAMFTAVMTSKHDEALAHMIDCIERSGEDEFIQWMTGLLKRMNRTNDPRVLMTNYCAIIGASAALLAYRNRKAG